MTSLNLTARARAIKSVPNVRYKSAGNNEVDTPVQPKPRSAQEVGVRKLQRQTSRLAIDDRPGLSPENVITDPAVAPPPRLDKIHQRAQELRRQSGGRAGSGDRTGNGTSKTHASETADDAYEAFERKRKEVEQATKHEQVLLFVTMCTELSTGSPLRMPSKMLNAKPRQRLRAKRRPRPMCVCSPRF